MVAKKPEKANNITIEMLNHFLRESGWRAKDLLLDLIQDDFQYSELFNEHSETNVRSSNIANTIIYANDLDDEFSKWWKKKEQKPTKFQRLYNIAVEYGFILEKESNKYILDDINGGEWICKTLKEVESILNDEIKERKKSAKNGGWVVDTIVHNGKVVKQGEITIES